MQSLRGHRAAPGRHLVRRSATAGKSDQAREIIEILLRYGADPSIKNKLGKRAADYVRDKDLLKLLRKKRVSKQS